MRLSQKSLSPVPTTNFPVPAPERGPAVASLATHFPVPDLIGDLLWPQTQQEAGPLDPASCSSPRLDRGPARGSDPSPF